MRAAYEVAAVRRGRGGALATLPDGTLMAAADGAGADLCATCSGTCTAPGWCCWSAAATTAATPCSPVRGWPAAARGSTRCCSGPDPRGGLAALRRGGRPGRPRGPDAAAAPRPTSSSTASSASAARRAARRRPARRLADGAARRAGGRRRRAERGRRRHRRGRGRGRPRRRHGDVRRASSPAPRRPGRRTPAWSSWSTSVSTCPAGRPVERPGAGRRRRRWPRPGAGRRQVHPRRLGVVAGRRRTRVLPCCASAAALRGRRRDGALRRRRGRRRGPCARVARGGARRRPGAGLGGRSGPRHRPTPRPRCATRSPPTLPVPRRRRRADGAQRRPGPGPRPRRPDGADPARPASSSGSVHRSATTGRGGRARRLAADLGAVGAAQGRDDAWSPTRAARVRSNPTGTAWLATAGTGDVLSGITGALLAARARRGRRRSLGACVHGLAARVASPAVRPITAPRRRATPCRAWLAGFRAGQPTPVAGSPGERRPRARTATRRPRRRSGPTSACCGSAPGRAEVMAVVKADAYGHGLVPVAARPRGRRRGWLGHRAARGGAGAACGRGHRPRSCPGCSTPATTSPTRSPPTSTCPPARLGASARSPRRPRAAGPPARLHLKVDTGLGRGGAPTGRLAGRSSSSAPRRRPTGSVRGRRALVAPRLRRRAGPPDHRSRRSRRSARPSRRPRRPASTRRCATWPTRRRRSPARTPHFDLVRPGLAVYGLSPVPRRAAPAELGLRPGDDAARPGWRWSSGCRPASGVSYGHTLHDDRETTLGAGAARVRRRRPARTRPTSAPVLAAGRAPDRRRHACAWTSSSLDVGDDDGRRGRRGACCSGPATTASRLRRTGRDATGTISYEIVTRIGPRVPRRTWWVAVSAAPRAGPAGVGLGVLAAGAAVGSVVRAVACSAARCATRRGARTGSARSHAAPIAWSRPTTASSCTSRSTSRADGAAYARPDRRVRARLRAQPRLLALPAAGAVGRRPGCVLLRPARARPVRPRRAGTGRRSTGSAPTCPRCSTLSRRPGRSSWSATRWAA